MYNPVRRSSTGRLWNDLDTNACLHTLGRGSLRQDIRSSVEVPGPLLRLAQLKGRLLLSDAEKATLAEIVQRMTARAGRRASFGTV